MSSHQSPEPYVPKEVFNWDDEIVEEAPVKPNKTLEALSPAIEMLGGVVLGIIATILIFIPLSFIALFFIFAGVLPWILCVVVPLGLIFAALLILKQIPSFRKYLQELEETNKPDVITMLYYAFMWAPLASLIVGTIYLMVMTHEIPNLVQDI